MRYAAPLLFAVALALVACDNSSSSTPPPAPSPSADASTYNPQTRLADASEGTKDGKWDVNDRTAVPLPDGVQVEKPATSGDAAVTSFEYPGGHFDNAVDMNGMKAYYYRTSDDYEKVNTYYGNLPGFEGGEYTDGAATFARAPAPGSSDPTITATITKQPTGGCQIILNVSP